MKTTERDLPWINAAVRLSGPARLGDEKCFILLHTTGNYLYNGGRTEPPIALTWYPYNGGAINMYDCETTPAAVTYVDDKRLIVETPTGKKEITRETDPLIVRWADDMSVATTIHRATQYAEERRGLVLSWIRGENDNDLARSLTYMVLDFLDGKEPEDSDRDHAIEIACVLLGQDREVLEALEQAEYI